MASATHHALHAAVLLLVFVWANAVANAAVVEKTYTMPLPPMRGGSILYTVRETLRDDSLHFEESSTGNGHTCCALDTCVYIATSSTLCALFD